MGVETAIIVGGAIAAYGAYSSSQAQAKAARDNAEAMRQQAQFNAFVSRREADIFRTESTIALGSQLSAIARSGVDLSGSALMSFVSSKAAAERQANAIAIGAAQRQSMAEAEARSSEKLARNISQAGNIQTLGAILNTYGNYQGYQSKVKTQDDYYQQTRDQYTIDSRLQTKRMLGKD